MNYDSLVSPPMASLEDQASNPSSQNASEVQVKFITRMETENKVPDHAFAVPVKLVRYSLSEIVNHLLGNDPPRPYDFLVNGEFLRTDLATFLESHKLSGENVLNLEYVEAMPAPEALPSTPQPDWISSIDVANKLAVVGCYDGRVRLLNPSDRSVVAVAVGHSSSVKDVKVLNVAQRLSDKDGDVNMNEAKSSSSTNFFVTASKDRTVRVWKYGGGAAALELGVGRAHEDSVETVAVIPKGTKFVSGGWDKKIHVWDAPTAQEDADEPESSKKRRVGKDSNQVTKHHSKEMTPLSTLDGHTQAVTAICWPHPLAVYSGSYDHSIRLWDVERQSCTNVWNGSKVISSLDFSLHANLLASGHEDSLIRLWDPRKADKEVVKASLKSHKGWVSCVRWSPTHAHQLLSASYDGTVKLWDIRSKIPLHTMKENKEKVLAVSWNGSSSFLSGGADCEVRWHRIPKSAMVQTE